MTMLRRLAAAAVAMSLATTPVLAAGGKDESPAEARETAATLLAKLDAAYNAHDAHALASLFAENATFVPANPSPTLGAVIEGRANIEKFFADAFKTFQTSSEKVVAVGAVDDHALWLISDLSLSGRDAHGARAFSGHVGGLVVRERGGDWEIRMATTNGRPTEGGNAASGSSR